MVKTPLQGKEFGAGKAMAAASAVFVRQTLDRRRANALSPMELHRQFLVMRLIGWIKHCHAVILMQSRDGENISCGFGQKWGVSIKQRKAVTSYISSRRERSCIFACEQSSRIFSTTSLIVMPSVTTSCASAAFFKGAISLVESLLSRSSIS